MDATSQPAAPTGSSETSTSDASIGTVAHDAFELARQQVHRARIELEAAERKLDASWQRWHERLRRHRVALLIGSGLLGGFAIATVAPKRWARLGALVFGGGAWLMCSALMPTPLGALWPRMHKAPGV